MSFWRGVANVLAEKDQQDYETRERQKERDYRTLEKKEDRAYQERMFMKKVNEERRTALYSLLAERKAKTGAVDDDALRAQGWVMQNLGGFEEAKPLLIAAQADPQVAMEIYKTVTEANEQRAKEGFGPVDMRTVATSFEAFGIRTTPQDLLDFDGMMSRIAEVEPGSPEYYELMAEINQGQTRPVYGLNYQGGLATASPDELLNLQDKMFDEAIQKKIADLELEIANDPSSEAAQRFSEVRLRAEEFGPAAFYDEYGREVAQELLGDQRFRNWQGNARLRKYFEPLEEAEDSTPEAIPTETPAPKATPTETSAPPKAFYESPSEMKPPELETAVVVPKEIIVDGQRLDISKLGEIDPEIIKESGAVPYEVWRGMSRKERQEMNLPLSEIGGQIRYMNRDGAYDFLINGWELMKKFADDGREASEYSSKKGHTGNLKPYQDTNRAFASEILIRDIKNGRVSAGERILFNGEVMEVTQELIDAYLGEP